MGMPWREHPAWAVVGRAEAALGEPIAPLLLDASTEDLGRTRHAQLAVLVTSLVAWEAARDVLEEPVAYAGHSLGQVTALIASGALAFDEGVRFAAARATATQEAADRHPGRMAALVGASIDQTRQACEAAPDECWLANDNAPGQVVIAGTPRGVDAATEQARLLGVRRAIPLEVGGAFHTPLMQDATDTLRTILDAVTFTTPRSRLVSNIDAQPHDDADWHERSARHVSMPVRWRESLEALAGTGVDSFVEIGHGSMIAALAKRTTPEIAVVPMGTPAQVADAAA